MKTIKIREGCELPEMFDNENEPSTKSSTYVPVLLEKFGLSQGILINGEWYKDYSAKFTSKVTHWFKLEFSDYE